MARCRAGLDDMIANRLRAARMADLNLSRVQTALASMREHGLGPGTINHHVRAVKAFSRWLKKDGRARKHLLEHLGTSNPESDRRRVRRALTPEEVARLIRAAECGPAVKGMTGPDRAIAYRVALGTGSRADELRSLTPASFRLDDHPPTIVCEAAYTKDHRKAEQPIPEALAALLRPCLAARPADRPLFKLRRPAEMLRHDLASAGIDHETAAGVIDFHAFRAAYVSHLVAAGASVKTSQVLARHSTPGPTIGSTPRPACMILPRS
jgi:integrase